MKLVPSPAPPSEGFISPKQPPGFWEKLPNAGGPMKAEVWSYGSLFVMSAFWRMPVAVPYGPDASTAPVPVFHLTISRRHGKLPDDRDCERALRDFGIEGAIEMPRKPTDTSRQFVKPAI